MKSFPYEFNITFNKKRYTVAIIMDRKVDGRIQCDYEILARERMSGDEFQKLKAYLEKEGYVDAALKHYGFNNLEL